MFVMSTSINLMAAETILLSDGRQVMLNDDFTWHYIVQKEDNVDNHTPVIASPVVTTASTTAFDLGDSKPILQLHDAGVDVVLGAAEYKNGALIFPTAITNQSTQSIILVMIDLSIYDLDGNLLKQQSTEAWLAIKRLADTYLRPKQATQGREITVTVPKFDQYQIKAEITEVKTRS